MHKNHAPDTQFLSGSILLAMPGMGDPRFDHAVIVMCAHSDTGAMGLIVNKPSDDLPMQDLMAQLDIDWSGPHPGICEPVHRGGPVEHGRGFVLHTPDYRMDEGTILIDTRLAMSASLDILRDMATGQGPRRALLVLGYAGWAPGQLESELQANVWLVCPASEQLVFDTPAREKWSAGLRSLGIDARMLAASGGRA